MENKNLTQGGWVVVVTHYTESKIQSYTQGTDNLSFLSQWSGRVISELKPQFVFLVLNDKAYFMNTTTIEVIKLSDSLLLLDHINRLVNLKLISDKINKTITYFNIYKYKNN